MEGDRNAKEQQHNDPAPPLTEIEKAKTNGYTTRIIAEGDWYSLELLVKPDEDLEAEYQAFDCEDNRMVKVKGWLFETKSE